MKARSSITSTKQNYMRQKPTVGILLIVNKLIPENFYISQTPLSVVYTNSSFSLAVKSKHIFSLGLAVSSWLINYHPIFVRSKKPVDTAIEPAQRCGDYLIIALAHNAVGLVCGNDENILLTPQQHGDHDGPRIWRHTKITYHRRQNSNRQAGAADCLLSTAVTMMAGFVV